MEACVSKSLQNLDQQRLLLEAAGTTFTNQLGAGRCCQNGSIPSLQVHITQKSLQNAIFMALP
jgi:hypothetical protein